MIHESTAVGFSPSVKSCRESSNEKKKKREAPLQILKAYIIHLLAVLLSDVTGVSVLC